MGRILKKIRHEFIALLPTITFFICAFNLIVLTDALTTEEYGIRVFSFIGATIAAVLVGKAVFLADLLPFMNIFSEKPLIFNTLWKTCIYVIATFLVRYCERIIHFVIKYKSFAVANQHLINDVNWPHFWAIQIWFFVIFSIYAAFQELVDYMGKGKVRQIFFGR